jgi:hypothetical protein
MLVPLIVFVAVSLVRQADVMSWPGANQSTHDPQLENEAFASVDVLAAEVIASVTLAGEKPHADALEFPAATAYETPSAMEFRTAWSSAMFAPPPRLMLATAGWPAWCCAVT